MQLIEGKSLAEVIAETQAGQSGERKTKSGGGQLADAAPSLAPIPWLPSPSPQPPVPSLQIPNPDTVVALSTQRESNLMPP